MIRDVVIPDLTFKMVKFGAIETPWDLRVLLYRGGAKGNPKTVFNQIAHGELGRLIVDRIELVKIIHGEIAARLVAGGARETALSTIREIRAFFSWIDDFDQSLSLEDIEDIYRHWCDYLLSQVRLKVMKNKSAYSKALLVSSILDTVLDRTQPLILTTRLTVKKRVSRPVSVAADKQILTDTFKFGHLCVDVVNGLSYEAIFGSLPVKIQLRDGPEIVHWSGLRDPAKVVSLLPSYKNKHTTEKVTKQRHNWESDHTLNTRFPLINLRIMAEMMIFIGQTGMNLSQAHNLHLDQYTYISTTDGYDVRTFKHRRRGEVLFSIYNEYREVFENYLVWRKKTFGETSSRLFPFIRRLGALETKPICFDPLRYGICKVVGIPFVSPQKLRNTRINWLLRRSRDPKQTAEQAQHMKETLLRVYEKPSLQVAQVEIIEFWKNNDPRLVGSEVACPAPGSCDGVQTSIPDLPSGAPKPDCSSPSGCLFCTHHRDIDSEDYVWSIASMRHFNVTILPRFLQPSSKKADSAIHVQMVIEVLISKLKWFSESNATRKAWVQEALEKLNEGDYHVHWRHLIESAEGV